MGKDSVEQATKTAAPEPLPVLLRVAPGLWDDITVVALERGVNPTNLAHDILRLGLAALGGRPCIVKPRPEGIVHVAPGTRVS